MSAPLNRYIAFLLRRRWLVLAAALGVMLVLAVGLRTIVISNDWRDMLDEGNPELVAFDAVEATYSATNAAVVAVAPKGGVGIHAGGAWRHRRVDRGFMARAQGHTGRLPRQL